MKMFKKIMAVVLTGAMAVSMLTGCAFGDAAKTEALVNALNKKDSQSNTTDKANDYKYEHNNSLDSKAKTVWTGDKTADGELNKKVPSTLGTIQTVKIGSTTYNYYMVKYTEKSADLKKTENWITGDKAKILHGLVKDKVGTAAGDIKTTNTGSKLSNKTVSGNDYVQKIEMGAAYVSNTPDGASKADYYVIVIFKTVQA